MADLAELTLEQRMALRSALSRTCTGSSTGDFGAETIELFLATSHEQFAARARSRPMWCCSPNASPANA